MLGQLRVNTPEGITFNHEISGVGSRSLAAFVDLLIIIALMIVVQIILFLLLLLSASTGALSAEDSQGFTAAAMVIIQFFAVWFYRAIFEVKTGSSIGYKAASLKVVTYKGSKPLFWQCLIRSFFWPFECVLFPAISFISIILTKKQQRLGDLLAGTVVVHSSRKARLGTLQVQDAALEASAPFRSWEISQVSDDEVYLIRRFLDRRVFLAGNIRLDLANKIYTIVLPKTSGIPTDWYAEAVLEGIAASRAVANARG